MVGATSTALARATDCSPAKTVHMSLNVPKTAATMVGA